MLNEKPQYQPVCDSDLFYNVIQTWENSKTGILKEVAVNIAGGSGTNTNDLVINVFKFSNVSDLMSLGYGHSALLPAPCSARWLT
jgi:hypothetical protein